MTSLDYATALGDVLSAHEALRPPNRMPVSEGAAANLVISRPGGGAGPYSLRETPYMREPIDTLGSRNYVAVCFVGPAQSGKTVGLGEGWMAHAVVNDPGDMLIVQMTQDKAREYSKQRIDRALRASPNLWALRGPSSRDDNLHDKQFKHGMWLRIAWPTASNLSSTSYRYVFQTDYDRVADDIDGEGDMFSLGLARIRTFGSRGKLAVESSPGRPVEDPHWVPATLHEAPPCGGILGIYNRSDRRRLYWRCPHCLEWFQASPGVGLFGLPDANQLLQDIRRIDIEKMVRQHSFVVCPNTGCLIEQELRVEMNRNAVWVPDGQCIVGDGRLEGDARTSNIAGFWLGGVAAAYQTWPALVRRELQGMLHYANTGEELALQTTRNTDQGVPYMSRRLVEAQRSTGPQDRKEDDLQRFVAPAGTRCILAAVDVQGGINARFVVQVHAIGEGREEWPIDRYTIKNSLRTRDDGSFAPIEPAVYPQDWDVLTERVLRSTYGVEGSDMELRVKAVAVDTGGEQRRGAKGNTDEGVAAHAYAWWRRLRREGEDRRIRLIKGTGARVDWHYRESMVGGKNGIGDVPLQHLNSNLLKDMVDGALRRTDIGPGFFHVPGWWTPQMFEELQAEVRKADGTWTQIRARNETFDLCYYIRALCLMLGMDKKNFWDSPPAWAKAVDQNSEALSREERRAMRDNALVGYVPALPSKESVARLPGRRTGRSSAFG